MPIFTRKRHTSNCYSRAVAVYSRPPPRPNYPGFSRWGSSLTRRRSPTSKISYLWGGGRQRPCRPENTAQLSRRNLIKRSRDRPHRLVSSPHSADSESLVKRKEAGDAAEGERWGALTKRRFIFWILFPRMTKGKRTEKLEMSRYWDAKQNKKEKVGSR